MSSHFAYLVWNANPILMKLGPVAIHWYGVLFALGLFCGYFIVQWQFRCEHKPEADLEALFLYMVVGAVVGARLVHCFFYEPDYYLRHPLEILMVWKGGLASHGGAAGILIALYLYTHSRPAQSYLWLLDRVAVPAALAGALIRLGNLFNSEILGLPATVPWAVVFAHVDRVPRHPVQVYEAIAYLFIFFGLLVAYRRLRAQTPRGLLIGIFFIAVFAVRFFLEFLKERQADYEQNLPISVGQMLSIPFIIVGVVLVWKALRHQNTISEPQNNQRLP